MNAPPSYRQAFDPDWWQFNMLPSKTLHPSHWRTYPPGPALAAIQAGPGHAEAWHRHWSRHILRSLGLWERPASLEAAAAGWLVFYGASELELLARRMGAVLCAPRLRRCVSGAFVRELAATLGEDLYALTLLEAAPPHAGLEGEAFGTPAAAVERIDAMGWGALRLALDGEDDALRLRMALRLPADAAAPDGLPVSEALGLAKALAAREIPA
ncbi:SctK family type III secretion system sorting platform protein [Bordetella genomosp. 10]|uniref:SctK family type III secretion system sorting platform protein n=1 Tax=Bordetella genomosp. 10 TaxID=1416804 RepID=UPI001178A25B|nr:SctK family type III secretion system sorting platform protein [Bordetella genomosp. 10]